MPKPGKNLIAQRYFKHPFLINGYKFDLRIYALVTSFDPLKVYLFHTGLVRCVVCRELRACCKNGGICGNALASRNRAVPESIEPSLLHNVSLQRPHAKASALRSCCFVFCFCCSQVLHRKIFLVVSKLEEPVRSLDKLQVSTAVTE